MWKAYEIGKGLLLPYKDFVRGQCIEGVKVILPFSPRTKDLGTVRATRTTPPGQQIFGCSEPACVLTFKSEAEAQRHMDVGRHTYELESVSVYDRAKMIWAEKLTGISAGGHQHPAATSTTTVNIAISRTSPMGWAL